MEPGYYQLFLYQLPGLYQLPKSTIFTKNVHISSLFYSADKAHLHQDYGLPGHFDMNFTKYQMEIELKLSDTRSLGHLAGQGVLHHLHQV